jgi:hypothetical protein
MWFQMQVSVACLSFCSYGDDKNITGFIVENTDRQRNFNGWRA